jgi:hypothetical protein
MARVCRADRCWRPNLNYYNHTENPLNAKDIHYIGENSFVNQAIKSASAEPENVKRSIQFVNTEFETLSALSEIQRIHPRRGGSHSPNCASKARYRQVYLTWAEARTNLR